MKSEVEIKTTSELTLTTQTVTPFINEGKIKRICPKEFCILVTIEENHLFASEDENLEDKFYNIPILLDKEGVKQLYDELEKFINTPF